MEATVFAFLVCVLLDPSHVRPEIDVLKRCIFSEMLRHITGTFFIEWQILISFNDTV
jgi:hypothetical protein